MLEGSQSRLHKYKDGVLFFKNSFDSRKNIWRSNLFLLINANSLKISID